MRVLTFGYPSPVRHYACILTPLRVPCEVGHQHFSLKKSILPQMNAIERKLFKELAAVAPPGQPPGRYPNTLIMCVYVRSHGAERPFPGDMNGGAGCRDETV